jgi:hypothetical protein
MGPEIRSTDGRLTGLNMGHWWNDSGRRKNIIMAIVCVTNPTWTAWNLKSATNHATLSTTELPVIDVALSGAWRPLSKRYFCFDTRWSRIIHLKTLICMCDNPLWYTDKERNGAVSHNYRPTFHWCNVYYSMFMYVCRYVYINHCRL